MIAIIAHTNQPKEIQVTTVTLAPDMSAEDPHKIYAFHCSRCGFMVAQHSGFVLGLFPGLEPTLTPVLAQCRRCEANYYFKSIVGK